jgi:SAM dependent carboxyl methyltransferase
VITVSQRPSAAMEGKGAYNRHSLIPSAGGALALPHLRRAIADTPLGPGDSPIVVADYGSSQGLNSLAPIRLVVEAIRGRAGVDRPIFVYHNDQPSNDFNSLFDVLDKSPDGYSRGDQNVFPCAIGRSFYESILPADSVHLGWSSYAAMWISRVPAPIPGHFIFARTTGEVRAAWARQGLEDWSRFLSLRGRELKPGGHLVISMPGADDDGRSVFDVIMDHANGELEAMVEEGAITADEWGRMALNVWPRRRAELVAPFGDDGRFGSLVLMESETCVLRDPAWDAYEADGDKAALATKRAMFFRSVFSPTLASYLNNANAVAETKFADRLTLGLQRRLAVDPTPMHSLVQVVVVAKARA